MFVRDPCGIVCIIVTYLALFYADYVVMRWIILHTMQDRLESFFSFLTFRFILPFFYYYFIASGVHSTWFYSTHFYCYCQCPTWRQSALTLVSCLCPRREWIFPTFTQVVQAVTTARKETTGVSAPGVKHTDHPEHIIVEFARGVFDEWITTVHGINHQIKINQFNDNFSSYLLLWFYLVG